MWLQSLHYIDEGEGLPVVFQHGLGGQLEDAYNVISGIRGIRLICMDSRGHGKTVLREERLSFNMHSDDIVRILDHLEIEKVVAGGISMGSGVALNLAIRYPDRVGGLIIVRPAWLDKTYPANLDILISASDFMGKSKGKQLFSNMPIFKELEAISQKAAASILGQFTREQAQHTSTILCSMIEDKPFDSLKQLEKVNQDTLVLASEEDPLHPFVMAADLAGILPNSQIIKVHSKYVDRELHIQQIRQHISDFLVEQWIN